MFSLSIHFTLVVFNFFSVLIAESKTTMSSKNSPWNFSWFKENEIAGSGAPEDSKELNWLKEQGIKHILCLDKWEMSVHKKLGSRQLKPLEFEVKLINIEEFEAPDSETVIELLQYLTSIHKKKEVRTRKLTGGIWSKFSCSHLNQKMNEIIF